MDLVLTVQLVVQTIIVLYLATLVAHRISQALVQTHIQFVVQMENIVVQLVNSVVVMVLALTQQLSDVVAKEALVKMATFVRTPVILLMHAITNVAKMDTSAVKELVHR